MTKRPQRKTNRLQGYDYSQKGAYFITICIKDRHELLGGIVKLEHTATLAPSHLGEIVIQEIGKLTTIYPNVILDCYVVMPNHVHMLIIIDDEQINESTPTVSRIIKQWKGVISKKMEFSPWQKSFHDHIIRNVEEHNHLREYIQNNPDQWELDCFYSNIYS